jgi:transitional endoplasmic reticulum ATPase
MSQLWGSGQERIATSEVELRVEAAKQRDIGRGIARISQKTMRDLRISAGDSLEVIGRKHTIAIAWPAYSEDQDKEIIRIDEYTQNNAKVPNGGLVKVRHVHVINAAHVTIAPINRRLDDEETKLVKNRFKERELLKGDITRAVNKSGELLEFLVVSTVPEGAVRIKRDTDLQIQKEPAAIAAEPLPESEGEIVKKRVIIKEIVNIPCPNCGLLIPIESTKCPHCEKRVS